jgi:VWFA-related protein
MRTILSSALAVLAVAVATSPLNSAAQQANNRERTLYVSAVDEQGEPVADLGPDAFIVQEDGRRREVLRVSPATDPMDLALFIDTSQAATDEITFFREALTKFVTALSGGEYRIALIGLAERPTVLVQYTSDTAQVTTAAGRLFAMAGSGMTLLDALYETSRGLRRRDAPRATFVPVVTDGVEFTNRYSKDIVRELRQSGAALHAVMLGQFRYSDEHSLRERIFLLDEGTKATGGQRITLLAPHGLAAAMERLARELSHQYKVVYGRPDSPFTGDVVEVSSARPGITMRGILARGQTGATK